MSSALDNYNKAFESKVRLGIMSILMVNEVVSFVHLKEMLAVTDGNLSSHLKSLEDQSYIAVKKQFIGKKPSTTFQVTATGAEAFKTHLTSLEAFLKTT
jgi:DNA-binding MarR family transcriptional regulator